MTISFILTRNEREIEVEVELNYIPGSRGHRDRYGCPEEPDEPPTFEIVDVSDKDGNDYDLSDTEYEEVIDKAMETYEHSLE
jgi:hypothetical protein